MKKQIGGWKAARREIVALLLMVVWSDRSFSITLLHEFTRGADDGATPRDSLILSGSTLYGMTALGGDSDLGTVFSLNTDGTGFTLLHEFAGGGNNGAFPFGSLILSGSTLYGMTLQGGDSNWGTIFSVGTDGSGFTLLHEFAGGGSDGAYPYGSLILSGSTLYGMTRSGGDYNSGTVFSLNTNGTGFTLLHEFAGGGNDGASPQGSLILSGSTLYGMTENGGDYNMGTVFSLNTDGTGFTLLHEFAGGTGDGKGPFDSLILSGSALYGTTQLGGDNDHGTVFSLNTNGTGFTLLHEFSGSDGELPEGSLILSGSTLYGTTRQGGAYGGGTVFSIGTDGTGFTLLQEFDSANGMAPEGSLILSGSTLYGMTSEGGDSGTVFSLAIPEPSAVLLALLGGFGLVRIRRNVRRKRFRA